MRVGITTDLRHSMFSAGHANTSFSLAQVFQAMGHEVVFLHTGQSTWWEDIHDLKEKVAVVSLETALNGPKFDLVVESSFFLTPGQRGQVVRSVWYNRKPGLFTDLEGTVYGSRPEGRNLEGISAIWTADVFTKPDDIVYLQTLYPTVPVYTVPWIWTPDIVETHRKASQSPVWLQVCQSIPADSPWSVHVAETNASSTSSCTLPLVIVRHLFQNVPAVKSKISKVSVHNTDLLQVNPFFKENVLKHCSITDLSYNLLGRQRIIDWVHDPHSILLKHNRFVPITMGAIEAAWVGLPLIHNSSILRDIGYGLEKLYYSDNSVVGAGIAIQTVLTDLQSIPYLCTVEALTEVRKAILSRFYPQVQIQGWGVALERTMGTSAATQSPATQSPATQSPATTTSFNILFTDMWDQFNESYNMFTLALDTALRPKGTTVNGYSTDTLPKGLVPDIVVFGPFGESWKSLPAEWPKVHFTGENTAPIEEPSVKLNIGYRLLEISDDSYIRMPLWQFEIDWFGAHGQKIQNPLPLPIDVCTKAVETLRNKFCAFVVTNPKNQVRNQAFTTLNSYKPVDSAGRLYNTLGDKLFAGLGGGGGELMKHEFLKDYRFCIAYENESGSGYTTEKLLHAKAAGCVPIYWGDPRVGRDFNEKGFLNVPKDATASDLVSMVKALEENPAAWKAMASVPALSSYTRDLVRRNFAELVRRVLIYSGRKELLIGLTAFLGAKTTAEANALRLARGETVPLAVSSSTPVAMSSSISNMLFVTGATQRFWPSVLMWIDSIEKHRVSVPLQARVYVGEDVSDTTLEMSRAKYDFVEFIRFPTQTPADFADFWNPLHYAWKLWIYNTVVNDPSVKGKLVFYMDSGSVLLRMPTEWLNQARESGLSFLDDCRQQNRHWCHEEFCSALKVTEAEKDAQQIAACLLVFIAGHPLPTKLFGDAYTLGQQRTIVVGEKWQGIGKDGKPFGHRHDQSILSILSSRMGVPRFPIDRIYGDRSARATFHGGQSVYVHRGNFKTHQPALNGIDEVFVINLERRSDRKQSFLQTHPDFRGVVRGLPAYDGRTLTLSPYLARLFKTNDFFWKKAVMGCALSHLKLWTMLVNEPPDIESFLILEDDARLQPGWRVAWSKAYLNLPEDWDCVYLGGILPPNKSAFLQTLERVAPGLARVAPNQIFGQKDPTRYFHFCAYAYVLSRRGAAKILESILDRDGYWTSADHMVCNRVDAMNLYVLDPLVAGASQDDDPAYQTAEFNNFSRVDNFDSDLWNNDERFTAPEIEAEMAKGAPLHLSATFTEIENPQKLMVERPVVERPVVEAPVVEAPVVEAPVLEKPIAHVGPRFIVLNTCIENGSTLYESKWLQDLFHTVPFVIESVPESKEYHVDDDLIVVVIRPNWEEQFQWLNKLRLTHSFKLIHLSDEFSKDPIDMYSWPEVKGVLRFYNRPDLDPKVLVVPLGYHWQYKGNRDVPHLSTPALPFRENMWSFAGTDWHGRSAQMGVLQAIRPHYVKYFADWRDPAELKEEEYISLLLNSKFIPCPRGQNVETYRFYEALDCGCIPMFIESPDTDQWLKIFSDQIPFLKLVSWDYAAALLQHFHENPELMEKYRMAILVAWAKFKMSLKEKVRVWISNKN